MLTLLEKFDDLVRRIESHQEIGFPAKTNGLFHDYL